MSTDHFFIPCAGVGSRMGPLGHKVPKALWRFFKGTLLDLQISLAKLWGAKALVINTHHLAEQFSPYQNLVHILHEPKLLGTGGALANYRYHFPDVESVCRLNCDVQAFPETEGWEITEGNICQLIATEVPLESGLNEIVLDTDQRMTAIETSPSKKRYPSFLGIGTFKLGHIDPNPTSFQNFWGLFPFDQGLGVHQLSNPEYWDWGTLEQYENSFFHFIQKDQSGLKSFLLQENLIESEKIYPQLGSYDSDQSFVINLSGKTLSFEYDPYSIVWDEKVPPQGKGLYTEWGYFASNAESSSIS